MPKHNLYPTPNPDGTDADRRVEIGWQRDRGAQIGVAVLRNPSNLTADGPNEPTWEGQFVDLNREQINKLIRTLRDARDEAFGRDE